MSKFYYGVVEDRTSDPLKLGRVKARISGIHSENKIDLPTHDLPWAMVMQPTHSAANSGIGHSPTGILEGTWVVLIFRDEDLQHPIVIGTLPGIPSKSQDVLKAAVSKPGALSSSDGTVWKDSSGNAVETVNGTTTATPDKSLEVKKPSAMTMSTGGFLFLKSVEGLSSTVYGKNKIGNDSLPGDTKIYSYLDVKGIWAIGWGNTFLANGTKVSQDTIITKTASDELFLMSVRTDYEKSVRRLVKVPLTQSMFDACVSMVYNMGAGGFSQTQILPSLNLGKYAEAAGYIEESRNNDGTLKGRRRKEKNLFLKDGLPKDDGTTEPTLLDGPASEVEQQIDATRNPVVTPIKNSKSAAKDVKQTNEPGFKDPNKKYPLFYNEPDTHRLSRHEKIDGTIVIKKEVARATGIPTASGGSWDQPKIPYNAKYPFNSVYASESGHVQEFDDTEGSERIHTYHKSGTYTEIDVNGTQVNRIVGDSFQIIERNGNVLIRGACNITIQGDGNIRVQNNATIEALGSLDIKAGGDIGIGSGGNIRLSASGEVSLDGSGVHLNSGKGGSVKSASGGASGVSTLSPLRTPNRLDSIDMAYETPEDGDPTEFNKKQIADGNKDPDETVAEPEKEAEAKPIDKSMMEIEPTSCAAIFETKVFSRSYKLTENTTLGNILGNSEVPSVPCYGVSPQQIVCNLKQLVVNVIEPLRRKYPSMIITNTWRSEEKNRSIGGSATSDHLKGYAVDIVLRNYDKQYHYEQIQEIQKLLPAYHQLILEYRGRTVWIHISYKPTGNSLRSFTMNNDKTYPKPGAIGFFLLT